MGAGRNRRSFFLRHGRHDVQSKFIGRRQVDSLEAHATFHEGSKEGDIPNEPVKLGHEQYGIFLPSASNGYLQLGEFVFLSTLDFEEGGHQLRVATEKILHRGLLGFEAETGLALADGTHLE